MSLVDLSPMLLTLCAQLRTVLLVTLTFAASYSLRSPVIKLTAFGGTGGVWAGVAMPLMSGYHDKICAYKPLLPAPFAK